MLLIMLGWAVAASATVLSITDEDIGVGDNIVWQTGDTILLTEEVFVEEGATLTIQPGVVVKGKYYEVSDYEKPEKFAALIICKGAQIFAEGTEDAPIVFTAEADDLSSDLSLNGEGVWYADLGLWGGVVVCGRAPVGDDSLGEQYLAVDRDDARASYGGSDPDDNSGVLRYLSIRYAGSDFVEENRPDGIDDIRNYAGLSLCGTGEGTILEYIETYNCLDDGIRFLGGTVNGKYLFAARCGNNSFDFDQGYRGNGQFWAVVQVRHGNGGINTGDYVVNHDGNGMVKIANASLLGARDMYGSIVLSTESGAAYVNSIFYHLYGMSLGGAEGKEEQGNLLIANNLLGFAAGDAYYVSWSDLSSEETSLRHLKKNDNERVKTLEGLAFSGSSLRSLPSGDLDFRLTDPLARTDLYPVGCDSIFPDSAFFEKAAYKGAFDPTANQMWIRSWTAYDHYGWLLHNDTPLLPIDSLHACDEVRALSSKPVEDSRLQLNLTSNSKGLIRISGVLSTSQRVSVTLHDCTGRRIAVVHDRIEEAGKVEAKLSVPNIAGGMYLCSMMIGNKTSHFKLPLAR